MICYSGLFRNIKSINYIIVFKNKLLTISAYEAAELRGVLICPRADFTLQKMDARVTPLHSTASLSAQAVMQGAFSVASSKTVWVLELQCSLPHTREDIKTLID